MRGEGERDRVRERERARMHEGERVREPNTLFNDLKAILSGMSISMYI